VITTLYLIRHALCDAVGHSIAGRAPGTRLNEEGREQARRLAERPELEQLDAIFSSPLERAVETATPLARRCNLSVVELEELNEIDYGRWTGKTLDALDQEPEWKRWNATRSSARVPGGEAMLEVQSRAIGALGRIHWEYPGGRCAIVSHGDVIRAALTYYMGIRLDDILQLEIAPASLSMVRLGDAGVLIDVVNRR
jgi:broad specificity phosphatase PhoE